MTLLTRLTCTLSLVALPLTAMAQSPVLPLDLSFLPPDYAPRNVCTPEVDAPPKARESDGPGGLELTDPDRIRYLKRDINRLTKAGAARYFDYIETLIARHAALDEAYTEIDAGFDLIALHIAAGRLTDLAERGLVARMAEAEDLTDLQRLTLSQYFRDGTGTPADPGRGRSLLLEAAFNGHARALLELVRLHRTGRVVDGWDAPLDLTVTMAFGGLLGAMDRGLCNRAEIIAQEYLRGETVRADPETALAWRRFAADMGGAEAAWRVVEHHLTAPGHRKDDAELRRYLRRAVELGFVLGPTEAARVAASGAVTPDELQAILGYNEIQDGNRPSDVFLPLLALSVELNGRVASDDGPYLDHLRELAAIPGAPGLVYLWLAREVAVKEGRWAGEGEIVALLEEAVRRDDAQAMQDLAERLVRYRDDPATLARAQNLLIESVEVHGLQSSMAKLDALYRCQAPDAPRLAEASHWATAYHATRERSLSISATDLVALDPFKDPETIARIQSLAIDGRSTSVARQAMRMLSDGHVPAGALTFWADRLDNSGQGLEAFAELEFELSTSPSQRAQAVEFFRRVYLNNGVTTALDLSIALIEDHARDPDVAAEILDLLDRAGHRGEGAAIRLLSRLQADARSPEEVYAEFAKIIEARGDFLALMFALPFVDDATAADYFDRAVSLMNCGTKDADELGDAHAIRGNGAMSYHWRQVGLHFDGGHVLAKLRLSNPQMEMFARGAAPDAAAVAERAREEGERDGTRRAFWLAANPDLRSYDPQAAAAALSEAFETEGDRDWAIGAWHRSGPAIREIVAENHDIRALSRAAAEAGDSAARYAHAMLLRERARGARDLAASVTWLARAAEAGHTDAMVELGFALGFGLGTDRDDEAALAWLARASGAANARADAIAALIRSRATP